MDLFVDDERLDLISLFSSVMANLKAYAVALGIDGFRTAAIVYLCICFGLIFFELTDAELYLLYVNWFKDWYRHLRGDCSLHVFLFLVVMYFITGFQKLNISNVYFGFHSTERPVINRTDGGYSVRCWLCHVNHKHCRNHPCLITLVITYLKCGHSFSLRIF